MAKLLETLFELWLYDIHIFSQWWLWVFLCIPGIAYTIFFCMKWAVITFPIWFPVFMILIALRKSSPVVYINDARYETNKAAIERLEQELHDILHHKETT